MSENNQPPFPRRNLALFVLLAANMLSYADRYVLSAVVPGLRESIFKDPEQYWAPIKFCIRLLQPLLGANPENALIGLLAMGFMVTYMIGAPIAAAVKWKRWHIIGVGVLLWSLATGASGMAQTYGIMLLTRCMVGVGEAAFGPWASTIIADIFPTKRRALALSIFQAATPLGSAIGFALGGFMLASTLGWRWAFYSGVVPGIIIGTMCFFLPEPKQTAANTATKLSFKQRVGEFTSCLKNRSYMYNMWASTAMTFAIGGIGFWIPSYIVEFRGQGNPEIVNLIFGLILIVAGIGGTLVGGVVSDRFQHKDRSAYMKVSAWAMFLTLPFTIAMLYVPFPYAWIFLGLAVFFLFFNSGSSSAIVTNVTPPALRASAFALLIFVIHALGDVISPFIIGAVADATKDMNLAFLVVSGAVLLSSFFWWRGVPHLEKDSKYSDQ